MGGLGLAGDSGRPHRAGLAGATLNYLCPAAPGRGSYRSPRPPSPLARVDVIACLAHSDAYLLTPRHIDGTRITLPPLLGLAPLALPSTHERRHRRDRSPVPAGLGRSPHARRWPVAAGAVMCAASAIAIRYGSARSHRHANRDGGHRRDDNRCRSSPRRCSSGNGRADRGNRRRAPAHACRAADSSTPVTFPRREMADRDRTGSRPISQADDRWCTSDRGSARGRRRDTRATSCSWPSS
jgi:hypothetical protein